MKIKNLLITVLSLGLIFNLAFPPSSAAQEKEKEEKAQESEKTIIPEEVKLVFKEGIATQKEHLGIPFTIIKHLYLPAQQNLHTIFLFRVKNVDLGFFPVVPIPESPEEKKEEEEEKTLPPETESPPIKLQANSHVFLQFNKLENNIPGEILKEVYIPINLEVESSSYEPDKEELYTTGYPLPPGNYLMSMAITSRDLKKIGARYFEFSLPEQASFTDRLETTPIFLAKNIKGMDSPETTSEVHKGFFTYSILQVEPNIENIFSLGEKFDVFYYIFGAQPGESGKYNIEANYEVLKGEEKVIRYGQATYEAPIVIQPIPLKKTVIIKSETEGEKKEEQNLEPGKYTFSINVIDNISGNSINKKIDFEII